LVNGHTILPDDISFPCAKAKSPKTLSSSRQKNIGLGSFLWMAFTHIVLASLLLFMLLQRLLTLLLLLVLTLLLWLLFFYEDAHTDVDSADTVEC
jgi:hypothetical protein